MMRNLILFYSRRGENYVGGSIKSLPKGNTEFAAEFIQNAVGGDLFEIKTTKPYAKSYDECIKEAKAELQQDARPDLETYLDSIGPYDNIFVCGPCWWGTFPCPVFSQLEMLDFTGKRVFPLMTHEGSGLGRCEADLQKLCPGAAIGKGLAVLGSRAAQSEELVAEWAVNALKN